MRMFEVGKFVLIPEPLQCFRYATAEMNRHKIKEKHTAKKLLQEQKLVGVLWERYGVPFPQNRKIFHQLTAHLLRDFGLSLMRLSRGKEVGRIFFKRALRQDLSNIDSWKYYIKSWAPPALHPRLFFFDKERDAKPDYDSAFAQAYLKWPPTIPPFEDWTEPGVKNKEMNPQYCHLAVILTDLLPPSGDFGNSSGGTIKVSNSQPGVIERLASEILRLPIGPQLREEG